MPELRGDEPSNLSFVNGSDYVFVQKYGDKESVRLWQLGDEVKECNLSACGIAGSVEQAAYIPEAELIIANAYDDGTDTYSTVLIDISAANFKDERGAKTAERDLLFNKSIIKEEVKWECPEELKNAQARAQQLEEKYGVRILIGESCREFFQSTALETFVCNSPDDIENALENMEKAFKLYPENFLCGFNDAAGGSGIIFMLVGGIEDNCSGYTEQHFDKNLIAVNTSEYDVYSTVCHELWHAAENFITKYDPNAFDDEMWSDLNPEGFEYCNSRDCNAWSFMKKGVASAEKPENTYFIQSYGCSYAFEDRATIMEEVMTGDYGIENIRECPHLKAKLRLMAEAIRQFFDTEGWGTPRWEEPLK